MLFHCLRGKGECYRLGTDSSANVKAPQKVEGLANKKVVQVAVGALHCLALTDIGEVSDWSKCCYQWLICTSMSTANDGYLSRCIPGAIMNMDNRGMEVSLRTENHNFSLCSRITTLQK